MISTKFSVVFSYWLRGKGMDKLSMGVYFIIYIEYENKTKNKSITNSILIT